MDKLSLLHPADVEPEYRQLPEETVHDLSFEKVLQVERSRIGLTLAIRN